MQAALPRWRWWPHRHCFEIYFNLRVTLPGPYAHTMVTLLVCACGVGEALPEDNWALAPELEQFRIMRMFGLTRLLNQEAKHQ